MWAARPRTSGIQQQAVPLPPIPQASWGSSHFVDGDNSHVSVKAVGGWKETLRTHTGSISYSDHHLLLSHPIPWRENVSPGICLAQPGIRARSLYDLELSHLSISSSGSPPSPHRYHQRCRDKGTSASRWVLFPSRMGLFQLHFTPSPEDCINISRRMQIREEKKTFYKH